MAEREGWFASERADNGIGASSCWHCLDARTLRVRIQTAAMKKSQTKAWFFLMAEREGFEPSMELPPYHLSKMAH
jgi:hypothetical protein